MSKWKCPNKANVPNHPETILFTDPSLTGTPDLRDLTQQRILVPKPAHCPHCQRSYLKSECLPA
jgi:hypothetical protein